MAECQQATKGGKDNTNSLPKEKQLILYGGDD